MIKLGISFTARRDEGARSRGAFEKRRVNKQNVLCIIYYLLTIVYYAVCSTSREARYLALNTRSRRRRQTQRAVAVVV